MDARKSAIPGSVLNDLCSRFILHVPSEEREAPVRLCFQIELAHWFYLDFTREGDPSLPLLSLTDFARAVFAHCPFLLGGNEDVASVLQDWKEYKMGVPTYGAIILDPSLQHVLLVQGYLAKSTWGFPKGKVNEDEAPHDCAVREVLEETGFDIRDRIDLREFIELRVNEQLVRLYIIPGVPRDTAFTPRTRKEIRSIEWFLIEDLPSHRNDVTAKTRTGLGPNKFFMTIPFIKHLREWIGSHSPSPADSGWVKQPSHSSSSSTTRQWEPKLMSKQRQQRYFIQQTQNEFNEILKVKGQPRPRNQNSPIHKKRHSQVPPRLQAKNSSTVAAASSVDAAPEPLPSWSLTQSPGVPGSLPMATTTGTATTATTAVATTAAPPRIFFSPSMATFCFDWAPVMHCFDS
ncbi:m7GpppN-mRNA hydrolase isoform X2 [Petromyzon marinus]|uniref:m7GpppN-mRNA hydrolase isoform X2 n=1 Tax=Petromyzon marinus TaxID=7757 RepID=UPI003F70116E